VLDDLAALGPFFAVGSHPAGAAPVPPWRPVSHLTASSAALRDLVVAARAALAARDGRAVADIEPRVAASAVHFGLTARLAAPALGAAVLRCPVDLRPAGLWWQDGAAPVPLSVPAPVPAPAGDGRSAATAAGEWDRVLLDELLAPVTAAVTQVVPVSGRVLWGNVASAVNAAAAQVAARRPDLARDAWRAASRVLRSPRLRGEPHPPGLAFRRSSCCLYYRLAPGNRTAVCGDCVLAARPTRRQGTRRQEI
jgi:FhuF 2Fe-2S C-terminal domain/Ferric iron reductase FhuF-like transporter